MLIWEPFVSWAGSSTRRPGGTLAEGLALWPCGVTVTNCKWLTTSTHVYSGSQKHTVVNTEMSTHIYMWQLKYIFYFASKQICHFVHDEPGFQEHKTYFKCLAHLGYQIPFCNSVTTGQQPLVPEQKVWEILMAQFGTDKKILQNSVPD